MDGLCNSASKKATARVVRQFSPSRIECQLLAQVFELVCGQPSAAVQPHGSGPSAAHIHLAGDSQAIDRQLAGRRAA